jgi:hypothetical protein
VNIGSVLNNARLVVQGGPDNGLGTEETAIRIINSDPATVSSVKLELQHTAVTGKLYEFRTSSDGEFDIVDRTGGAQRLVIASNGNVTLPGGLDVGGAAVVTGTLYGKLSNPASLGKYTCHNGPYLNNSTTETSMLTGASSGSLTYPINTVNIGMMIRITTAFSMDSASGTNTLTLRLKTDSGTLASISWVPPSGTVGFRLNAECFCRSTGSSAYSYNNTANFAVSSANTLSFTAQWSSVTADNIRMERMVIENIYHE